MNVSDQQTHRIAAVGEVLWDVFPTGPRFGGAPANFACSCSELGGRLLDVKMVSAVGRDSLGIDARQQLVKHQVSIDLVSELEQQTGRVDITLDEGGSASYQFAPDCAWDHLPWSEALAACAATTDVVCFGSLGQRSPVSQATIQRFVAATPTNSLRIFDINIRKPYYSAEVIVRSLELANVLKLNDEELPLLQGMLDLTGSTEQQLRRLMDQFGLRAVAYTRGADGALLLRGDETSDLAGKPIEVIDTVGAGDSFTAAFALGLLRDLELHLINERASEVAAFVCSHAGATPQFPPTLFPELRAPPETD